MPAYIAEAVGLADSPWQRSDLPSGVGVAQFDPVLDRDDPRATETVIERWGLGEAALERFTQPLTCAVSGRRKLLRRGDEELWIDLDADPLELAPMPVAAVPPADSGAVERLRAALEHPAATASREYVPEEGVNPESKSEAEDLEERMRQLGYL